MTKEDRIVNRLFEKLETQDPAPITLARVGSGDWTWDGVPVAVYCRPHPYADREMIVVRHPYTRVYTLHMVHRENPTLLELSAVIAHVAA